MTFLKDTPLLYEDTHLSQRYIRSFCGRVVEVTPLKHIPVLLEFDGAQVGKLPVRYGILPQALRLFAPVIKVISALIFILTTIYSIYYGK